MFLILIWGTIAWIIMLYMLPVLVVLVFPIISFLNIRLYEKSSTILNKKYLAKCLTILYIPELILISLILYAFSLECWKKLVELNIITVQLSSDQKGCMKLSGWVFFLYVSFYIFNMIINLLYKKNIHLHQAMLVLIRKQKKQIFAVVVIVYLLGVMPIIAQQLV